MRSIFILLSIFVCFTIQGQNQIFIKSKNTNQPIPYANIWESNKIYTSSDSLGSFFIGEKYLNSKFKVSAVVFCFSMLPNYVWAIGQLISPPEDYGKSSD